MMSLNRADDLRGELEEKHGFNAEQANGTMKIVDEMVDHGIDRVLKSIADSESRLTKEMASLRSDIAKDIASVRSVMDERFKVMDERFKVMDERFKVIDDRLKDIEDGLPYKSALLMIAVVAAYAAIFGT